jgi:hypothetical protein
MDRVKPGDPFDFNQWAELARRDPEAFSQQRCRFIEEYIANMEPLNQPMLIRVQFRIDMERRRARTPLKACLRLSSMMWDSFYELKSVLGAVMGRNIPDRKLPARTAQVLAFRRR